MFISKFSRSGARAAFKGLLSKAPPTIRSYKSYYPIIQNDYLKPSSCKLFSTTATENSLGENEETKKASKKMSKMRALWQASLTATKRALTWNIEDMIPPSERFIYNFNSKEELKKWHLYSDSEYGGLSSAALEITDTGKEHSGTGVFSGNLSLDVTEGTKWNISRSGFCGMRSKKFDGFIDLDPYDTIALKLKGDGRSYISTIYTENWVNSPGQMEDNSWQAFVAVPRDDWVIAKIPLAHYLPTWRGNVIEADIEMNPSRVVGMSLSVNAEGGVPGAQTGPGDFRLEIEWIKALRTQ